ncbi:MAG TPA: peptidoglycan DD-metalloendopeptidase family protein [Allosphingosinicella sp.]|nr:peptidoglycan DD-metalloendopeptidase family protein [Allosphingosinicella sp.]
MRRFAFPLLATALLAGSWAAAQTVAEGPRELLAAKQEAELARRRSQLLERQAERAIGEAARARAEAAALAGRIQAAEADITAAETRIRLVEQLRREQRARLAEKQAPLVRLTAALQTMARRPAALALVQPGSVDEIVHVRSLLASSLPLIRERTEALRAEIDQGNRLRKDADTAYAALTSGRRDLQRRRVELARFEQAQRAKSQSLAASAFTESGRALALSEEARDLAARVGTRAFQDDLRRRLSALPGPRLRPGAQSGVPPRAGPTYILPVSGRLVTGMGEISDAGVHARGITFAPAGGAEVIAPASGRIAYAGPFRGYGEIVVIDHGGGWTSTITDLAALSVKVGDAVRPRQPIGRAGTRDARVTVELRRNGRPFPIAPLIAL